MSRIKKQILNKLKEYANKMGRDHLGGDDYTSKKKGGLRDFDGYDNVDYNKDMPMDEASRGTIHKAAKKGSYPVSLVVVKDGKVINQVLNIRTPEVVPAAFNVVKNYHKHKGATVHIEDKTGKRLFSESVNEAMKPSQVRSAISKVKKGLMRKWKQKGGYENFGQKELDKMKSKFDYNPYGSPDERQISKMLDGFDNWAMNYDGNMREEVDESKFSKKPEVTPKQLLKIQNDIKKVNRKIKVYISKHPVTKGELSIELGHGHDNDSEIYKIYDILKKHTGSSNTGSIFNESIDEKINLFVEENVPTDPSKWSYYKAQAKKKFDVYPSAYANGWAAKKYKAAGGGWKKKK